MKVLLAVGLIVCSTTGSLAQSGRTFGGYACTDDCSGHAAGYRWAENNDTEDEGDCPSGNSSSFYEGCQAYVDDKSRGADEDDDGQPIE